MWDRLKLIYQQMDGGGLLISSLPFEVWVSKSQLSVIPQEKDWHKEINIVQTNTL